MAPAFGAAKGQGEDGVLFRASWRSSLWSWRGWAVPNLVGGKRWSARPWRQALMMAVATGLAPAREHVWGVAVVLVSEWEKGEGERRAESMGLGSALSRPGRVPARSGTSWRRGHVAFQVLRCSPSTRASTSRFRGVRHVS